MTLEPESRYTPEGKAWTKFGAAQSCNLAAFGQPADWRNIYVEIVAFDEIAESIMDSNLHRGDIVTITGKQTFIPSRTGDINVQIKVILDDRDNPILPALEGLTWKLVEATQFVESAPHPAPQPLRAATPKPVAPATPPRPSSPTQERAAVVGRSTRHVPLQPEDDDDDMPF